MAQTVIRLVEGVCAGAVHRGRSAKRHALLNLITTQYDAESKNTAGGGANRTGSTGGIVIFLSAIRERRFGPVDIFINKEGTGITLVAFDKSLMLLS